MGRAISTQPDPEVVRSSFRGLRPAFYDFFTAGPSREFRAVAVERLALRPGDAVIDLGCGTGLSLSLLVDAVGPGGRVTGVDASPHMLARARQRVEAAGWRSVELVEAFAQDFQPQEPVDGVLACNVNQLICSPEVVQNAVAWLKPGGRFVATGSRRGPGFGGFLRALFLRVTIPLTQRERSAVRWILQERPWQELERTLGPLEVEYFLAGAAFVAWGVRPPAAASPPPGCG
jgi:demethylmenaquinone methyltransferase/2-methoxy-6-polyprenyl-1,4-benzoquinol methylase